MFGRDFNFNFNVPPLQSLIQRAVDPFLQEPNYAAHLEVAEYINQKKANTPRDAAMTIVHLVNNRNPHISMLALGLLETLVQSCGYPFHLQISTKEFLNELVRRFPERPPPFPGPVMTKILELIHTWKETICTESRWKDDLGNIRDMHRLLQFKGYRFREIPRQQTSIASTSTNNLKTAEELEEEDREAQSAKLQELIRRGTPRDLAAAQELMKVLAGADPDKKPDYKSQSLSELNKLEQKVILLNEMLDNVDVQRGERFANGDAYDQVSSILSSARPKIQKWISDAESNDPETLDIFLQINDQINTVLNRYEAFKKGDFTAAANPIPAELAGSSRNNETSLIDFDDSAPSAQSNQPANDLAGLFDSPAPAPAPAASSNAREAVMAKFQTAPSAPMPQFGFPAGPAATSPSPQQFGAIMLPGTPKPQTQSTFPQNGGSSIYQPSYQQPFGNLSQPLQPSMNNAIPSWGSAPMNQTSPSPQANPAPQAQGKDPFADLAGLF